MRAKLPDSTTVLRTRFDNKKRKSDCIFCILQLLITIAVLENQPVHNFYNVDNAKGTATAVPYFYILYCTCQPFVE